MKKLFLVVLAIAMTAAFTMPAEATQSRVAALGGYGRYLEDDFNIFEWPATLPSYGNMVWIELMDEMMLYEGESCPYDIECWNVVPAIGASYMLGEDGAYGTLAMFFYAWSPPLHPFAGWEVEWPVGPAFMWSNAHKFHVMYGYAMEGFSFGFQLTRSSDGYKYEDGTTEDFSYGYTTIGAGVRFDIGDNAYTDINFDLGMGSSTQDPTFYGELTEDGNMIYGLKARMFYEWNETVTLIPYFGWSSYNFSFQADDDTYNDYNWGDKGMMMEFGLGTNITVNEDNLLLFAIDPFSYYKREPSEIPEGVDGDWTATYTIMPRFILGLESDVRDWLTFRMGGVHELYKIEEKSQVEDPEMTYTSTGSDFSYYMGLGFHVGDWDIDCVLNNGLPFHLGYWLTGYTGTEEGAGENAVGMVSAKYHF